MRIRIGCCGFPLRQEEYYKLFPIVETQSTFYKLPSAVSAERWRQQAPRGFEFSVKAWQGITHQGDSPTYRRYGHLEKPENYGYFKPTDEVRRAWSQTDNICRSLGARWVLFQCPGSFGPTDENIANLLAFFKGFVRSKYRFAWEPRGEGWTDAILSELCRKADLVHCVDPFAREPVTKGVAYFRLHGCPPGENPPPAEAGGVSRSSPLSIPPLAEARGHPANFVKMYSYEYTKKDLEFLRDKCAGFREVRCLFNNTSMHKNALEFMAIMS